MREISVKLFPFLSSFFAGKRFQHPAKEIRKMDPKLAKVLMALSCNTKVKVHKHYPCSFLALNTYGKLIFGMVKENVGS